MAVSRLRAVERMTPPTVSVVLPVHNRDAYLREAIDSIMTQSLTDFELLIVDDASTNPAVGEIVSEAERKEDRIRVIHHQRNRGAAGARNTGIAEAKAPLVAFMDDDDVSLSDRLLIQREYLSRHPDIVAVGTGIIPISARGKRGFRKTPAFNRTTDRGPPAQLLEQVRDINVNASAMVRKEALQEVGGYREWFRRHEDTDLTFRIMERMSIARTADRLYLRRAHQDELRASLRPDIWDYYAAAVFSLWCRHKSVPDPVENGIGLPEILGRLGNMDGVVRRHLIWIARRDMRRWIKVGDLENFVQLREKVRILVQDGDDSKMFALLLQKSVYWVLLYGRLRFWKEVRE